MKGFRLILCFCLLLLLHTSNAFALNTGTWTLSNGDLVDGAWQEVFAMGPGSEGSVIQAPDLSPTQWFLKATLESVEKYGLDGYDYKTIYYFDPNIPSGVVADQFSLVAAGPWGEAFSIDPGSEVITNYSTSFLNEDGFTPEARFRLEIEGIYTEKTGDIFNISAFAIFDSTNEFSGYETDGFFFQTGKGFEEISLTITSDSQPVPEPASLLLLGFGLAGIAGFGRKRFIRS